MSTKKRSEFRVGDRVRFRHAQDHELFTVSQIIPDDRDYLDGLIRYEIVAKDSDGDEGTPYPEEDFEPKQLEEGDRVRFADQDWRPAGRIRKLHNGIISVEDSAGYIWGGQPAYSYRAISDALIEGETNGETPKVLIPEVEFAYLPSDSHTLSAVLAEIREVNSQTKILRERQRELKSRARVLFQQALRAGTE